MKLYELLANTGISFGLLKEDTEIVSITCDSRRVEPGCLFVCIEGTAVDGHRFAADAQQAGAAAVLVQRDLGLHTQLMAENTRMAWAQIYPACASSPPAPVTATLSCTLPLSVFLSRKWSHPHRSCPLIFQIQSSRR